MQETLNDFHTSMSIGGRPLCNLRFAEGIELMGGSEAELQNLTTRLEEAAGAFGMEVSSEISQVHSEQGWQLNQRNQNKTQTCLNCRDKAESDLEKQFHQPPYEG